MSGKQKQLMPKLTKRLVDAIKPDPARDVFAWDAGDGSLKGFGVRMKPSGSASYLIQYRNREGRTRRLALAKVGTITTEEARAAARKRLAEVAEGDDPSAQRKAARQALSVAELCDMYLKAGEGRIKPSTLAMDRSRIETHVKPLIGNQSVRALTSTDVERMKTSILAGKTAKARPKKGRGGVATGGAGVAARTVGMLVTILEFARKDLRLVKENVGQGVKKPVEGRQRRFLLPEEITALGQAMTDDVAGNEVAHAAIRFLLLSGFRRMEALALPRTWLDVRARCVRLQDSKSGYQVRALGSAAIEVLQSRPKKDEWFFAAARGHGHFVGLPKVLERLCKKAELDGVTLHVLRHSFAATAAALGFSELTIAGLLGHSVPGVTARYAHIADTALVSAADRVSAAIAAMLAGESAAVVDLRDARVQRMVDGTIAG